MSWIPNRDDFEMCERENDSLRAHLAWAAERLNEADRAELARRIEAPMADGGVVPDGREEEREHLAELQGLIEQVTDHVQVAIDTEGELPDNWYFDADRICCRLRGYLTKKFEPTLHEVREAGDKR